MSYIKADRVKETTIIVGTGTVSLLGTSTGFRTFASQMTVGDTCSYIISNASGSEWESGIATYSAANTLTRTSVNSSSNSNNRVVFTGGVKDVFIGVTADSVVDKNNARLNTINAIPVASGVGNDLTLIAGSGVGVGAGGNIVLTPGSQGSSGGDGKVLIDGLTVGGAGSLSNAALGYNALKEGASILSVAVGSEALAVNRGLGNSALGASALKNNTNGNGNTVIGDRSSFSSTEGSINTSIGGLSLYDLTTGSNNIALGSYAGNSLTTGSNNIFIGASVYAPTASTSDFLTIGNVIFASGGFGSGTTVGVGNVGIGQNAPTAKLHVTGTSASTKVAIVQGASSQTANLQEWQNNSGTALSFIDSSGSLNVNSGTITASDPAINITQTWNNAAVVFSGLDISITDAASQATSTLINAKVGGTSNFYVWRSGAVFSAAGTFYGVNTNNSIAVSNVFTYTSSGTALFVVGSSWLGVTNNQAIGWGANPGSAIDTSLYRDAADTLAQRRSTNPQTFRVYNTYTDASNYERLGITWASTICTISPENAGTGSPRALTLATPSLGTTGTVPALSLVAGNGTVTGAKGGSINITAGNGGSGNGGGGGSVTIAAGVNVADNTQPPGNITITAGATGGASVGGSVTIQGGTSSTGGAPAGGTVNILGGAQGSPGNVGTTSGTGSVVVKSPDSNALMGSAATSLANPTGNVSIATGNGGTISTLSTQPTIRTGSSGTISISTGAGGNATVVGTTRNAGSSGTITISTSSGGNASGGTTNNGGSSGSIIIGTGVAGTGSTANGTVGTIQFNVGGINTANVLSTGLGSNAVTAIPLPTAATVTAATGNGTTVTYTAANTFSVGQVVSITGLTITTGSSLNLSNQTITTASATQFTITNATVGTADATQAGTATIQSAGNSVTITAGNGSGVGAGGNIILQPGAQGSGGGNGVVRFYSSAGVATGYWDPNTSTLNGGDTLYINSKLRVRSGAYINGSYGLFDFATANNASNVIVTLHDSNGFRMNRTGIYGFSNDVYGTNWTSAATDAGIGRADFGVTCVVRDTSKNGGSLSFPSTTTAFSANTNDLALTASAFQRINCTSAASLTGIAPPSGGTHVDGRMIRIYNVGTANLTLAHNSASSTTPTNRFWNSTGADIVLSTHQYVELIYDSTDNGRGLAGWRVSSVH
jgi:hypothetical protein